MQHVEEDFAHMIEELRKTDDRIWENNTAATANVANSKQELNYKNADGTLESDDEAVTDSTSLMVH